MTDIWLSPVRSGNDIWLCDAASPCPPVPPPGPPAQNSGGVIGGFAAMPRPRRPSSDDLLWLLVLDDD